MPSERRTTLGEQIQQLRREKGRTQKGLADILKHSVTGCRRWSGTMLQRLAAALGVRAKPLVEIVLGPEAGE